LSYFFGVFGIDRFYLGYLSLGVLKLFTGGFLLIGYIFDCMLITLQLVGPSDGSGYDVSSPFPYITNNQHHDIL